MWHILMTDDGREAEVYIPAQSTAATAGQVAWTVQESRLS